MSKYLCTLLIFLLASCHYDYTDIGQPKETLKGHYITYDSDKFIGKDSCQVILTLSNDKVKYLSKNEKVKILGSRIIIYVQCHGTFRRYMCILVDPDIRIEINDTVYIE